MEKEYLIEKGLLKPGFKEFVISAPTGNFNLTELLNEFAEKREAELLKNIVPNTQRLVQKWLDNNPEESQSSLAKLVNIHPLQLLAFMRGERGLTTKTLSRLGEFLIENL